MTTLDVWNAVRFTYGTRWHTVRPDFQSRTVCGRSIPLGNPGVRLRFAQPEAFAGKRCAFCLKREGK